MESRKVQKVGASTLSVSLPKAWASRHELERGDIILFETLTDGSLRLSPSRGEPRTPPGEEEYVVNADLCTEPGLLGRVVVGNYVIGRNSIRIRSKGRIKSEHLQEVRTAVSKLMGIGIMMESSDEIELQASIDPARFPMETVIKRLYTIAATMQKEAVEALEKGDARLAADAMGREDEADRMYWLALRLLLSAQANPSIAGKIGMNESLPIVGNRLIAKNLETIADYAENAARNAHALLTEGHKVSPTAIKRLRKLSDMSAGIVGDALACIFSRDIQLANRAIEAKEKVEEAENDLQSEIMAHTNGQCVANLRAIAWSLRRIAEYGSEIAVIGINRYLERDSQLCHVKR